MNFIINFRIFGGRRVGLANAGANVAGAVHRLIVSRRRLGKGTSIVGAINQGRLNFRFDVAASRWRPRTPDRWRYSWPQLNLKS